MKPFNRHLLIEPIFSTNDKEDLGLWIPEDFHEIPPYLSAKVLNFAEDCKINIKKEQVVVVDSSMIQEIEINEETHFLILENYVIGSLD
jgi:hypothetical protein